jgi:LmeA-like phospholipid-binding
MSDGFTRQLPLPPFPEPTRRRRGRLVLVVLVVLAVLAGLLAAADRVAASYAQNRIASQLQPYGFASKPVVTVEGFPFLTQLISRHLDGVQISGRGLRAGALTMNIKADATGIRLTPGYRGGVISHLTGTGLISFASLTRLARAGASPALTVSPAAGGRVKVSANAAFVHASAVARVRLASATALGLRIVSVRGLPLWLLGPLRTLTIPLPALPLGLAMRGLHVTARGVIIRVSGHDVPFGR